MWKHDFKIGIRQLKKHAGYTLVHVLGLSLAIAVALILYLAAHFEWSFDRFHTKAPQIYQAYYETYPQGNPRQEYSFPIPFAPQADKELAGIAYISRYADIGGAYVQQEAMRHDVTMRLVDPDFLKMYSFTLVSGNPETALNQPESLLITQGLANRIFGAQEVLGKALQLQLGGELQNFVVRGVLQDPPETSSIQFEVLGNFQQFVRMEATDAQSWSALNHQVFVELQAGVDPQIFQQQARKFTALHFNALVNGLEKSGAQKNAAGDYAQLKLLPLAQVHHTPGAVGARQVPTLYPYVLMGVSLLILLVACSNFINLNLATSFQRHKEIGMRKTLGGLKGQIIRQFWVEAFLICIASVCFVVMLSLWFLPEFNALTGYQLSLNSVLNIRIFLVVLVLVLGISLFAGGYPAWRFGGLSTLDALAGEVKYGDKPRITQVLGVLQFSFSMLILMTAIVASRQIQYLLDKPLGYNPSTVISIPISGSLDPELALQRMRQALTAVPYVESVTGTEVNMGLGRGGSRSRSSYGFDYQDRVLHTDWIRVDYDYLETMGISLISGRDFSREHPSDSTAVIINEAMVQMLGKGEWVGKSLPISGDQAQEVIGVMKNFHTQTLHEGIAPLCISINANEAPLEYIFVRVRPGSLKTALQDISRIWADITPQVIDAPSYLDENVQRMYRQETRLSGILNYGSLIAICIACIGLFSLTALLIKQKLKEIGIRKVLGADLGHLLQVLGFRFLKLVLIAFLISTPLAWLLIEHWLSGFAYRISSPMLWIAFAGLAGFLIALGTVLVLVIHAARTKPVHVLKYS